MKRLAFVLLLLLTGCGYEQQDAELVGQAKKFSHMTPLVCPNYAALDISLGVMMGGTGSMSSQDVWVVLDSGVDQNLVKRAVDESALVKVRYNVKRVAICTEDHVATAVELLQ